MPRIAPLLALFLACASSSIMCDAPREYDPLHVETPPVQLNKKMLNAARGSGCADPHFRRALTAAPRPGQGPAIVLVLGTSMTVGRGLGLECPAPYGGGAKRCAWPARLERWAGCRWSLPQRPSR